jgi:hypothetical protein
MNPWAGADRFLAVSDTADRGPGAEDLIVDIAAALSVASEYVVRIDLQPTQRVADFNWAARQAGRRLGIRVDVTSTIIKSEGQLQVRVSAASPPA